jgi:hypothetical protein
MCKKRGHETEQEARAQQRAVEPLINELMYVKVGGTYSNLEFRGLKSLRFGD